MNMSRRGIRGVCLFGKHQPILSEAEGLVVQTTWHAASRGLITAQHWLYCPLLLTIDRGMQPEGS